jgi:hypothetical protein
MNTKNASRLSWSLCGLSVLLTLVGPLLSLIASESVAYYLWLVPVFLILAVLGTLIAGRRPGNAIGWLFLAAGLMLALTSACTGFAASALSGDRSSSAGVVVAWLSSWLFLPALLGIPPLLFLLFPDGRLLNRRWRPALWLTSIALVTAPLGDALVPGTMTNSPVGGIENPVAVSGPALFLVENLGWLVALVGLTLATASLALRYRRSRGSERLQMRWFVSSAVVFLVSFVVSVALYATPFRAFGGVLVIVGFTAIPLATGLAILRDRLFDIDLVIKRTLVYGALTAVLVATYLVSVLAFRVVLDPVTGESDLAVAISTLAVAALFRPLRARIQAVVDRRFFRSSYDASRTLESFAGRLRHEVDLDTLGTDLRSVVRDTMHPAHVTLWLPNRGRAVTAVTIPERPRSRKVSP